MTEEGEDVSVAVEGVPAKLSRQEFVDWLGQIGLDALNLRASDVNRNGITAEVYALNNAGQK
jgi:hypothetical protein